MESNARIPQLLLTEGGPLYRIEKRLNLIGERGPRLIRVAGLSILLTWVPLFLLAAAQGTAFRTTTVAVPFLNDFAAYTRFLLALPLLIIAEAIVGPRLAQAASFFVTSGLVLEKDYPRFDAAVERELRLRDSTVAELLLLVGGYALALAGGRDLLLKT